MNETSKRSETERRPTNDAEMDQPAMNTLELADFVIEELPPLPLALRQMESHTG